MQVFPSSNSISAVWVGYALDFTRKRKPISQNFFGFSVEKRKNRAFARRPVPLVLTNANILYLTAVRLFTERDILDQKYFGLFWIKWSSSHIIEAEEFASPAWAVSTVGNRFR
jgi:hypothetical protein